MKTKVSAWLLVAAATAVAVRLIGIGWGLPHTLNADEPHVVNLAVSFGAATLKPYSLKYPTLWPYMLFFAYGLYFLAWSVFGLRRGPSDFAALFAWEPGGFFLIGRLMAAGFSLLALWVLWRHDRSQSDQAPPWSALLLAFSPVVVEAAHAAKPDCAMLFFASLAWLFSLRVLHDGLRRDHWLAGLAIGLALACQYTAWPVALALPLAHAASRKKWNLRWLFEGVVAAFAALFAASPYVVIDFPRVVESLSDFRDIWAQRQWSPLGMLPIVMNNMLGFAGPGSVAGLAALVGLAALFKKNARQAFVLSMPLFFYIGFMLTIPESWPRYMMGGFPAMALLAREGLWWAAKRRRGLTAALAVLTLGPGLARCLRFDWQVTRPDNRELARRWIEENIPPGTTVLLDQPHASPQLRMTREQVLELAQRSAAAGSPRARLYRAMADGHPGGGYRILRVRHTAQFLAAGPKHVEQSQADAPVIDVDAQWRQVRAAGVRYVVTSTYGRVAEDSELYRRARLLRTFDNSPDKLGPRLRIFELKAQRS